MHASRLMRIPHRVNPQLSHSKQTLNAAFRLLERIQNEDYYLCIGLTVKHLEGPYRHDPVSVGTGSKYFMYEYGDDGTRKTSRYNPNTLAKLTESIVVVSV